MNPFTYRSSTEAFNLELCVASGQVFRWRQEPDGSYFGIDGANWYRVKTDVPLPGGFIQKGSTGGNRSIERDALSGNEAASTATEVTYEVESNATPDDFQRLFRLDLDTIALRQEILSRGPEIAPYLGSLHGLRLMRPSDVTETFFSFLCTPNNNLPRIMGMVRTLSELGEPLTGSEERHFPRVEAIAAIPEATLRERKFGYRGATIPKVAHELAGRGGEAYLEALKMASIEQIRTELVSLPGVGPKLADCIALFALHRTEVVPIDTHIWQAITRLYFPEWREAAMTDLKYRTATHFFQDRFGELSGWVQQFLFFDSVLNWRSRRAG